MEKSIKINSWLPVFPGFYNTIFEPNEEYLIAEGKTYDDYNWNYLEYYKDVAERCCEALEESFEEFEIKIEFQNIHSPKEYNFSNDIINCQYTISQKGINKILKFLNDHFDLFHQYIKNTYSSRSGFISFYSNDAYTWIENFKQEPTHKHYIGSILNFVSDLDQWDLFYACESSHESIEYKLIEEEE